jgi:hypothetical protein
LKKFLITVVSSKMEPATLGAGKTGGKREQDLQKLGSSQHRRASVNASPTLDETDESRNRVA